MGHLARMQCYNLIVPFGTYPSAASHSRLFDLSMDINMNKGTMNKWQIEIPQKGGRKSGEATNNSKQVIKHSLDEVSYY